MATEQPTPVRIEKPKKNDTGKILMGLIIFFLLVSNGFLFYNYRNSESEKVDTEKQLVSTEDARATLDSILQSTKLQLQEYAKYKGVSEELDQKIAELQAALNQKGAEIEELLKGKKISQKELDQAYLEIETLKYQLQKYAIKIDSLSTANKELISENLNIKNSLQNEQKKSENLEMKNISLTNKVSLAQRLVAQNVKVVGVRFRSNGKESEVSRANKVEQLKMSFNFADNPVADKNNKDLFIRIIGPDGATINIPDAGSGTFKLEGQETIYTARKTFEFDNSGQPLVIYFKKGSEFMKGVYHVEFYCEGFLVGKSDLDLK